MNKKLALNDIITLLTNRLDIDVPTVESFVMTFGRVLSASIATDERVRIKGLGTFMKAKVDGEMTVRFQPDKEIADAVNSQFMFFEPVALPSDKLSDEEMNSLNTIEDADRTPLTGAAYDESEDQTAGYDVEPQSVTEAGYTFDDAMDFVPHAAQSEPQPHPSAPQQPQATTAPQQPQYVPPMQPVAQGPQAEDDSLDDLFDDLFNGQMSHPGDTMPTPAQTTAQTVQAGTGIDTDTDTPNVNINNLYEPSYDVTGKTLPSPQRSRTPVDPIVPDVPTAPTTGYDAPSPADDNEHTMVDTYGGWYDNLNDRSVQPGGSSQTIIDTYDNTYDAPTQPAGAGRTIIDQPDNVYDNGYVTPQNSQPQYTDTQYGAPQRQPMQNGVTQYGGMDIDTPANGQPYDNSAQSTGMPMAPQPWAETQPETPSNVQTPQKPEQPATSNKAHRVNSGYRGGSHHSLYDKPKTPWFGIALAFVAGILMGSLIGFMCHDNIAGKLGHGVPTFDFTKAAEEPAPKDTVSTDQNELLPVEDLTDGETASQQTDEAKDDKPTDDMIERIEDEPTVVTDTITPKKTLSRMAVKHYGKADYWVYIYKENKDKIRNPNNVLPGTILVIPPRKKYDVSDNEVENLSAAKEEARKILYGKNK